MAEFTDKLYILTGKDNPEAKREFIFAHVELGRVEDEKDDNICNHVELDIFIGDYSA